MPRFLLLTLILTGAVFVFASLFPSAKAAPSGSAHDFTFVALADDQPLPLAAYAGKAVLVVNTASQCGFTPQYEGLQALYEEFGDQGLEIIGVPSNDFGGQEPGSHDEIAAFTGDKFGVTFPMTHKYSVKGEAAHPFFKWAADQGQGGLLFSVPRWNFHKYLVAPDGSLAGSFGPQVSPDSDKLRDAIVAALGE